VPIIELQNVSKRFGSTLALDSVSLRLHAGEIVGLLGHNGSGKSTLVGVLAGAHTPEPGARACTGPRSRSRCTGRTPGWVSCLRISG
jgi:ABC-type sugar transport system ATPase subunit